MGMSFASRLLGILLLLFSSALLPPVAVSLYYRDGQIVNFLLTVGLSAMAGLLLLSVGCGKRQLRLRTRDGFVVVTLFWVVISLIGSLPFMFCLGACPAQAFFESASAFTTTGATVFSGLDAMPYSILFYRQEMQWLGGIGVIVSAIALMPMLGIGGMQLYKAETAGPIKDEKLTPRIAHTARIIWRIYLGMTVLCAASFWLAGMEPFDAIAHSLSTVSTGGFSTHDQSVGYFHSGWIEALAIVFMLMGSISFNVHFLALRSGRIGVYWNNVEVRAFLLITLALVTIIAVMLYLTHYTGTMGEALRSAAFEAVSVISSTGYGTDDFSHWPSALPILLMFSSFIGGCGGSTSGGMKVIRFVLLSKQALLELQHLLHPNLVRHVKLGNRVVKGNIVSAVWGFFAVYVACFVLFMLLLMADGLDQTTAFGAVAACMNNLGPGLGKVATSFAGVSGFDQCLMGVAMSLGRLEIFTILVLFSPSFWRG